MARCTKSLFVAASLFCVDVAAMDAAAKEKAHKESVCMASTLGFGPALTKAGLQIDGAVKHCGTDDKLACAVNVLSVTESCSWVAAYIVAAAGDCTGDADRKCTNRITGLVGSIVAASQASAGIAYSCPKSSLDGGKPGVAVGSCVVDTWQAAWALARAGILINAAVIDCEPGASTKCTLDALGVTASIVSTAHYVLGAVNSCSVGYSHGVACAKASTKLVGALTKISAAAIGVEESCGDNTRRLANTTQGQQSHQPLTDKERMYLASYNMTEDDLVSDPMKFIRMMMEKQPSGVSQSVSDIIV